METLSYKGQSIYKMNQLKNIMPGVSPKYLSDFVNPVSTFVSDDIVQNVMDQTMKREEILLQRAPRNYTVADMLRSQDYLEALEFLESVKYLPNHTNARKILHQYLHSQYDIRSCNLLEVLKSGQVQIIKSLDLDMPIPYDDKVLIDIPEEKNQPTPAKSLRKYLAEYLTMIRHSDNPQVRCGIFSSGKTSNKDKERFYLQLSEIPGFLLLFTYFDGRDFSRSQSQKNPNKTPPVRKERQCSRFSYRLTLEKIQKLCDNRTAVSPYEISTMLRCDTLFFHLRLNLFMKYFERYTSPEMLNQIIQSHSFTYSEIVKLKDYLIEEIFKDPRFIITGLKCPYLDFMLPFDINFQYLLIATPNYGHRTSFVDFSEDLKKAKNDTLIFLTAKLLPALDKPIFTFEPTKPFSVLDNETTICKQLKEGTFFKTYFCSENKFIHDLLEHQNQSYSSFWDFDTIKKILPIVRKEL